MSNLILTRRKKEGVVIYKDGEVLCEIVVTSLGPSQCKLGFVASKAVKIDRKEIFKDQ
jgi:sRNA-binding carbon storage regulator CsrA|tara:strand:+ start:2762 stop:2935 length:174 start_codon:yes stop_codon:yes gene_type:complete